MDDSQSWKTFRLAANTHQRTFADEEAQLFHDLVSARATAEKVYANATALAGSAHVMTYEGAYATAHNSGAADLIQQVRAAGKRAAIRNADIWLAYTNGSLVGSVSTGGIISAQEERGLDRSAAQLDYELAVHDEQRNRDNDDRESRVHNRGIYETEIRQEHRDKLQAASTTAIWSGGSPMQNLITIQRSAAQTDVTWSTSKGQVIDNYEQALSAAYMAHEVGMRGLGGAHIELTAAAGAADVAAVTAQANADAQFSISATGSLANYAVQSQSAATKALRDGVKAETKYDLERIKAQRHYNDALAAANVMWTAKYVEIQVAIYLDQPIPYVPATYQNPRRHDRRNQPRGADRQGARSHRERVSGRRKSRPSA